LHATGWRGRGVDHRRRHSAWPASASTPIVVFAHAPLWMAYEAWGWGTEDGADANPVPINVPPGALNGYLGVTRVSPVSSNAPLAIVDTPLSR
jgi:hypothetical protein